MNLVQMDVTVRLLIIIVSIQMQVLVFFFADILRLYFDKSAWIVNS